MVEPGFGFIEKVTFGVKNQPSGFIPYYKKSETLTESLLFIVSIFYCVNCEGIHNKQTRTNIHTNFHCKTTMVNKILI